MLGKIIKSWSRNESGATLVEYGIAVLVAVVVGTAGLVLMADQVTNNMDAATAQMAETE